MNNTENMSAKEGGSANPEGRKNVTIYTTPTCHFCHMTKEFFKEHNIPFTEYDVAANRDRAQEMMDRSGQMGVPVIFIDNEMVIGFDEGRLRSLLNVT